MSVFSERSSDSKGRVETFAEKETFFFMRGMEEEVVETEGCPIWGSGGIWSMSVGESAPEEVVEVAEA